MSKRKQQLRRKAISPTANAMFDDAVLGQLKEWLRTTCGAAVHGMPRHGKSHLSRDLLMRVACEPRRRPI